MPTWLLLACMTLANYRATRLVVRDDLPPILWLRDRIAGGWREPSLKETEHPAYPRDLAGTREVDGLGTFALYDGKPHVYHRRAGWSPYWLAELVSCPWCVSGWLAAALTAGAASTVGVPAPGLVWGAVWGASALLASREWA